MSLQFNLRRLAAAQLSCRTTSSSGSLGTFLRVHCAHRVHRVHCVHRAHRAHRAQYAERPSDISLIFKSAQPDIYIFLKLIWHHCFCSLVKGHRDMSEQLKMDGGRSYINCSTIIPSSSEVGAAGKQPPHVLHRHSTH